MFLGWSINILIKARAPRFEPPVPKITKFVLFFLNFSVCLIVYSNKLKNAGVEVKTEIFSGQIHGFLTMGARISAANKLINMISNYADKQFNKK